MQAVADLGGPTWFNLGDRDLATHVERTRRLHAGESLTAITKHLGKRFGVTARILPMADDPVRTMVESDAGTLAFQEYFVRDRCRPVVHAIRCEGASSAKLSPQVNAALSAPDLAGIIICPSNPWLSIDPILAVPGMRHALRASGAPVIAVTPIVGGRALKGPTAKIMIELGLTPSVQTIVQHYAGVIHAMIVDEVDAAASETIAVPTSATNTVMRAFEDKVALAARCLDFCARLGRRHAGITAQVEPVR
jgi:LPPG:FO 2-phospho-L-lactate transferase